MLEVGRVFGVLTANIGASGGYATAAIQSNFGNPWHVLSETNHEHARRER
jgi:hypothetical protein